MNTLYFGDNLEVLKKFPTQYVDLIYLNPPFQSGKNYNLIFQKAKHINGAPAQIEAFKDTLEWGKEAEEKYLGLISGTITITYGG